jgi:hypothetical protein
MQVRSDDESSAETLGSGAALWRTKHWRWKKKRARWRVVYTKVRAKSTNSAIAPATVPNGTESAFASG